MATQQELPLGDLSDLTDVVELMRANVGLPPIMHAIISPGDVKTLLEATDVLRRFESIMKYAKDQKACRESMRDVQGWALLMARLLHVVPSPAKAKDGEESAEESPTDEDEGVNPAPPPPGERDGEEE